MSTMNKCLVSKESGMLQIPYQDYVALMERVKHMQRMRLVRDSVVMNLQGFLGGEFHVAEVSAKIATARTDVETPAPEPAAEIPAPELKVETPAVQPEAKADDAIRADNLEVPPIKKNISIHFNNLDESGRLFNVFKQYYACLNDACGGTVRVTMKDGFCSLWNYDEWEEFAFIDILEGQLRIALDPRYTDALQSLNLCEVPRLLSSRRNLVCVQVDGLNNTMLEVLVKAFNEVGLPAS